MDNALIILTDKYPYGNGETYIETERPYWSKFDHVFICPVLIREDDILRESFRCKDNEKLITTWDKKVGIKYIFKVSGNAIHWRDIVAEVQQTRGISNTITFIKMAILINVRYRRILKELLRNIQIEFDNTLIYSYWMYEPALVAVGLKMKMPNARFITRAHGYDLYEERHVNSYIPYRNLVLDATDAIYPISEDGRQYLSTRYKGMYDWKISVERLGTVKMYKESRKKPEDDRILVVSCSNMVPLKRIDRIIEALRIVAVEVDWYHFGDGELEKILKEQAATLPANIHPYFMGRVPNKVVQKFYADHEVHAFINVSETEGVPVSIMEAQSYGIPVVATDVGGTSEIVHDGKNGVLLRKDFMIEELRDGLLAAIDNKEAYGVDAVKTWKNLSDAQSIYKGLFQREYNAL